jgi:hypothetical protein
METASRLSNETAHPFFCTSVTARQPRLGLIAFGLGDRHRQLLRDVALDVVGLLPQLRDFATEMPNGKRLGVRGHGTLLSAVVDGDASPDTRIETKGTVPFPGGENRLERVQAASPHHVREGEPPDARFISFKLVRTAAGHLAKTTRPQLVLLYERAVLTDLQRW